MTRTKKEQARRSVIIHELSRLSRDGWRHAKPCDYQPLEAELRALDEAREGTTRKPNTTRKGI